MTSEELIQLFHSKGVKLPDLSSLEQAWEEKAKTEYMGVNGGSIPTPEALEGEKAKLRDVFVSSVVWNKGFGDLLEN